MNAMLSNFFACMCCGQQQTVDSTEKKKKQGFHQIPCSNENLTQTLKKLEQKEVVLKKRVSQEMERAKGFIKSKNREASLRCLKRKRHYEAQLEQLARLQLLIRNQKGKLSNLYQNIYGAAAE